MLAQLSVAGVCSSVIATQRFSLPMAASPVARPLSCATATPALARFTARLSGANGNRVTNLAVVVYSSNTTRSRSMPFMAARSVQLLSLAGVT